MSEPSTSWPSRAPYALCLTHDVDRVWKQWYHYVHQGVRGGWRGVTTQLRSASERIRGHRHYWNFGRIMALEASLGVRSTFLFLQESAKGFSPKFWGRYDVRSAEMRAVIRELDAGGWEVGLHGSYYSYNDRALLQREKEALEQVLGKRVRSTRQHFLNCTAPDTWRIQREIGLEVDSTVGHVRRPWDDWSRVLPFYEPASGMLELPITLMDTIRIERTGMRETAARALEEIRGRGGLIVLDWHQRTFTPGDWPEAVAFYRSVIERAVSDGAWIAPMSAIADHWTATRPAPAP